MDCPACHTLMASVQHGTVSFAACRGCGGLWFGPGELARLLRADELAVEAVEEQHNHTGAVQAVAVFTCPSCGVSLDRYKYQYTSPVLLDGCPGCGGVFVQDEELAEIVKWRNRDTSEEDRDAAVGEALSAADARMVKAIRESQAATRASRALTMRWGLDGGLFTWSTQDVFAPTTEIPPPPRLKPD